MYVLHQDRTSTQLQGKQFENELFRTLETPSFSEYSRFSHFVTKALDEIEHIFVLTSQPCRYETLPENWLQKSSCVAADDFDRAFSKMRWGVDNHHLRIGHVHRMFVTFAQRRGFHTIAVIEADAFSYTNSTMDGTTLGEFRKFIQSSEWDIIRFGYRPFFLENSGVTKCPKECSCHYERNSPTLGRRLCVIKSRRCDIRSSDMYILNERSFTEFSENLERFVVDMEAIQSLRSVWYMTPQESFQFSSSQMLDSQLRYADKFMNLCRT